MVLVSVGVGEWWCWWVVVVVGGGGGWWWWVVDGWCRVVVVLVVDLRMVVWCWCYKWCEGLLLGRTPVYIIDFNIDLGQINPALEVHSHLKTLCF